MGVGTTVAVIGAEGEDFAALAPASAAVERPAEEPRAAVAAPAQDERAAVTVSDGRVKAAPLARRIARERGIELSSLIGTGPDGRIVAEDVEQAAAEQPAAAPAPAAPVPVARRRTSRSFSSRRSGRRSPGA